LSKICTTPQNIPGKAGKVSRIAGLETCKNVGKNNRKAVFRPVRRLVLGFVTVPCYTSNLLKFMSLLRVERPSFQRHNSLLSEAFYRITDEGWGCKGLVNNFIISLSASHSSFGDPIGPQALGGLSPRMALRAHRLPRGHFKYCLTTVLTSLPRPR